MELNTDSLTLGLALTAAGAAALGGVVAGVVQVIKGFLPADWQHGRAILAIVYVLAGLVVIGAIIEVKLPLNPGTIFLGVLSWQGVAAAAIGAFEVGTKAVRVASGSTNPTGEDAG